MGGGGKKIAKFKKQSKGKKKTEKTGSQNGEREITSCKTE